MIIDSFFVPLLVMQEQDLSNLFARICGVAPEAISKLPSSGSNRQNYRLTGAGRTVIGTIGTNVEENRAFCYMSSHFRDKGLPVPEVYGESEDGLCYLQEDLGDTALFDHRENHDMLKRTIRLLADFQMKGAEGMDYGMCYPQPEFDARMIGFDLNYFKYCFLKPSGVEFNEITLDDEFSRMRDILLAADCKGFMYRDFQARNVMLKDGAPYFIDFQGGRRGPVWYDLASFVYQAKANYGETLRKELIDTYFEALKKYGKIDRGHFDALLRHFVLFRTLQVMGAYGFRGLIERKPHFLQSIPFAMSNLRSLLQQPFEEYPYLCSLLEKIARMPRFCREEAPFAEGKLNLRIYSFSYRKGIPDDLSGNGGGYVFDCRGLENPGRYEQYKHSTGLDKDVREFLDNQKGTAEFLNHLYALADAHVQNYIQRGFSSLMFSCGCTGGQHRSVYCAQHLADYLKEKYPQAVVTVCHREQQ